MPQFYEVPRSQNAAFLVIVRHGRESRIPKSSNCEHNRNGLCGSVDESPVTRAYSSHDDGIRPVTQQCTDCGLEPSRRVLGLGNERDNAELVQAGLDAAQNRGDERILKVRYHDADRIGSPPPQTAG